MDSSRKFAVAASLDWVVAPSPCRTGYKEFTLSQSPSSVNLAGGVVRGPFRRGGPDSPGPRGEFNWPLH